MHDVRTEKRRYFQVTLGMAVDMGILWYGNYMFALITECIESRPPTQLASDIAIEGLFEGQMHRALATELAE